METKGEKDFSSPPVRPKVDVGLSALRNLPGSSDLSQSRKELDWELVVVSASDPLSERNGWTAEEVRFHWN